MIKRRLYKEEHGDRDGGFSDSDSSSSDSDSPPENNDDDDGVEEEEYDEAKAKTLSPSSESGYESEDSSGNEVGCDSSGLPVNEEEESSEGGSVRRKDSPLISEAHVEETKRPSKTVVRPSSVEDSIPDLDSCILKYKSVFKCRLCPRIVCLNENTARAHLTSKRHARSKKLLGEGRLKLMLNSDGEIEEDQETHAERHARTVALAKEKDASKKRDKGRKRQRKRRTKKLGDAFDNGRSDESIKRPTKKQRKTED